MAEKIIKETEVVVIGSGPGGATVARQLALAGRQVLLLERGMDWRGNPLYGTYPGCMLYIDKSGLLLTKEKLNIVRGIMTGGSSNLYCGTSALPPEWMKDKYGVDIDAECDETVEELNIGPLPDEHLGTASIRCMDAANEIGLNWEPYPKFMNVNKCHDGFKCGAKCMLGCRCGAKWTANEYMDEAISSGAELMARTRVERIVFDGNKATGVIGTHKGIYPLEVRADVVVSCGGGIGSARLLQRSGLMEAGQGMLMDPTVMVYGVYNGPPTYAEPQMTVGSFDDSGGYILSHLADPLLMYPLIMMLKGPLYPLRMINYHRTMGIMIKVKDEVSGGVFLDGSISKPLTEVDLDRLEHAEQVCHKILIQAGANPRSIFMTPLRGTHPSGTVRIGEMLDTDLKTRFDNLYVCDASVFPEALDRPIVLTLLGMGKRLSKHILAKYYDVGVPEKAAEEEADEAPVAAE
ncbi:GMC family oxidoreductase N-terminal domain-containing protein [bacterium]